MISYQSPEEKLKQMARVGDPPHLLLHCCCAPCACSVIERLASYCRITMMFYNPNIAPFDEYSLRADELRKLTSASGRPGVSNMIISGYCPDAYNKVAEPFMDEPEGGARCRECYRLRLEETAKRAAEGRFDCFATTLSVSPHKNAEIINDIGCELGGKYGVEYLCSDFKKNDGYKRSVELSRELGLYRQSYCGCNRSQIESLGRHTADV